MEFKDRLKELRKQNKMTQNKLAKKLNYVPSNICGYETGRFEPNLNTLIKLAEIFGVSVDYLLGVDDVRQRRNYNG